MQAQSVERKTPATDERRAALRLPAAVIPSIVGLHLSPGGRAATLLDISSTGALVRCATKLLPGTSITVNFDGGFSPAAVKARVVRCLVGDVGSGGLSYHIGLAFKEQIPLEEASGRPNAQPETAVLSPTSASPRLVNRW